MATFTDFSVWQLDQRMRELFDLTTAQLVLQLRMEDAATRLLNSNDPIISIALETGHGNQSNFSRQFRKTFGMPPGDYRRGGPPIETCVTRCSILADHRSRSC